MAPWSLALPLHPSSSFAVLQNEERKILKFGIFNLHFAIFINCVNPSTPRNPRHLAEEHDAASDRRMTAQKVSQPSFTLIHAPSERVDEEEMSRSPACPGKRHRGIADLLQRLGQADRIARV